MITIYGSAKSSSGRCFWCLEEIGQPYERKAINFREREHKSEAYLEINPNGKVPALTDGDYIIWESMAINLYLAEKYKPSLLGSSLDVKGKVYQWSIWAIAELQAPLIDIFIQMVFVPEEKRDQTKIDDAMKKLPVLLGVLEKSLTNTKYLAGDEFTLADLNTLSVVSLCEHVKFELNDFPKILGWRKVISEREAYKRFAKILAE